jgi:hypothetical protein
MVLQRCVRLGVLPAANAALLQPLMTEARLVGLRFALALVSLGFWMFMGLLRDERNISVALTRPADRSAGRAKVNQGSLELNGFVKQAALNCKGRPEQVLRFVPEPSKSARICTARLTLPVRAQISAALAMLWASSSLDRTSDMSAATT